MEIINLYLHFKEIFNNTNFCLKKTLILIIKQRISKVFFDRINTLSSVKGTQKCTTYIIVGHALPKDKSDIPLRLDAFYIYILRYI